MSLKTNKSFTKRLKITRNGKIVSRAPGQNHFNAKESSVGRMSRRRSALKTFDAKTSQRYIKTVARTKASK
jgi:ribosomal protein L35